jgi:hypothetical protein
MTFLQRLPVAIFIAAASAVLAAPPPVPARPAQTAPGARNLAWANSLTAEAQKAPPAKAIPL